MQLPLRKRLLAVFMLSVMPLASSEPISLVQEAPMPLRPAPPRVMQKIEKRHPAAKPKPQIRYGVASWYSERDAGIQKHTANGEVFDDRQLTCASWDYAFGTKLKVENLANGRSVVCRVNDRGPHKRLKRIIDLTKTAFGKIENQKRGLIRVAVSKVSA